MSLITPDGKITSKACARCGEVKPMTAFAPYANCTDGHRHVCRECTVARQKAWAESPEQKQKRKDRQEKKAAQVRARYRTQAGKTQKSREVFGARLMWAYGIDAEDWARMFNDQRGRCPGCGRVMEGGYHCHVDHCHKTGKVRGLLCSGCNRALGGVDDRPETLRQLALYLERAR